MQRSAKWLLFSNKSVIALSRDAYTSMYPDHGNLTLTGAVETYRCLWELGRARGSVGVLNASGEITISSGAEKPQRFNKRSNDEKR